MTAFYDAFSDQTSKCVIEQGYRYRWLVRHSWLNQTFSWSLFSILQLESVSDYLPAQSTTYSRYGSFLWSFPSTRHLSVSPSKLIAMNNLLNIFDSSKLFLKPLFYLAARNCDYASSPTTVITLPWSIIFKCSLLIYLIATVYITLHHIDYISKNA